MESDAKNILSERAVKRAVDMGNNFGAKMVCASGNARDDSIDSIGGSAGHETDKETGLPGPSEMLHVESLSKQQRFNKPAICASGVRALP